MRTFFRKAGLALALSLAALPQAAWAQNITVFAAASLKNAMDDIAAAWKAKGGVSVNASYASSSTLAKQIEQGAPADIFVSADRQWMAYVDARHLVRPPHDLLGNRLVLVANSKDMRSIVIQPGFNLAELLGKDGRLAVGDPSNVPAGIYAKQSLEKLNVWPSVENKLAPAADVRGALALVSRGEAPFGIVYATDAKVDPGVRVAGIFPEDTHEPIVYPIAVVAASKNAAAEKFVAFLDTAPARDIFQRYGFTALKQ